MAPPPWPCVCFLGLISIVINVQPSVQTCTELELQNMKDDNKQMKAKESSLFILSVSFNTRNCHGKWTWSLVKLSSYEQGIHVDLCKFILRERTCNVTTSSSSCTCSEGSFLHFSKRATQADNKIFIWKWHDLQSNTEEKEITLTLFVEAASRSNLVVNKVIVSCFVIVAILAVLFVLVIKLQYRVKPKDPYDNAVAVSASQPQLLLMNQDHDRRSNLHQQQSYDHQN